MIEWIKANDTVLWWLAASSAVMFVATLLLVPWLIVRIPEDYFARKHRRRIRKETRHPLTRGAVLVGKNILGGLFILVGVVLLALPGQGLLTILVGVMLLNFPGKFAFERWLVTRRPILRSVNWLRRRSGRPPLILDA